MSYEITGRVCARPCEGFEEPVSNGRLLFYGEDGSPERSREPIGEGRIGPGGRFKTIELDGVEPGEPIAVVVEVGSPLEEAGEGETVRATLTTIEFAEEGESREYEWCLTPDQYCDLMRELGVRYVCGQITDCDTGDPLPRMEVRAFDADIVQPDPLGTDTTDAGGWYVIYYERADFEETPAQFPPIELIDGPDLFFEVALGSDTLLEESPEDGRREGREDAGHCEHVDLCVDFETGPTAAAWTSVGRYAIPDSTSLNGFDADGYSSPGAYAFFGTLPLEGSVPLRNVPIQGAGSAPVRYRFLVGDSQLRNGASGTASGFNRVVGDGNDLFGGVHVGTLVYQTRSRTDLIRVHVEPGDVKADGWVRIDEAITDAYNAATNPPAGLGSYKWAPTGNLAGLDTGPLTSETMPDTDPGDPVPGSPPVADEHLAIRFEIQERTGSGWRDLPGHGRTLNRIVVNNTPEFREFEIAQLVDDQCDPITTSDVDVRYTVYHPHMEGVELEMRRADQNTWTTLDDGATEVSFFGNDTTDAKFDHNYNDRFDVSGDVTEQCVYLVRFRSRRRLTTGRSRDGWSGEVQGFYAEET